MKDVEYQLLAEELRSTLTLAVDHIIECLTDEQGRPIAALLREVGPKKHVALTRHMDAFSSTNASDTIKRMGEALPKTAEGKELLSFYHTAGKTYGAQLFELTLTFGSTEMILVKNLNAQTALLIAGAAAGIFTVKVMPDVTPKLPLHKFAAAYGKAELVWNLPRADSLEHIMQLVKAAQKTFEEKNKPTR